MIYYQFNKKNSISKNAFVIFFGLLLFCACNKYERSKESIEYLENPKIGDLYFIEKENEYFSIIKISNIKNDSISFYKNNSSLNSKHIVDESINTIKFKSVPEQLNHSRHWSDSIIKFSKSELTVLYTNNLIYEIKRD